MKCVFFMPMRCASRFIICTNASSDPAMASASAMQASLPDCMIMPCNSSSTLTGLFGSMNMREPGCFQARSDTATTWSGVSVFCLSAPKDDVGGHQLGQRGRFDAFVLVGAGDRLATGEVVQQPCFGGDSGWGRYVRECECGQQKQEDQQAYRCHEGRAKR